VVDQGDVKRIDLVQSAYEDTQAGEIDYIRELLGSSEC
jgi:hypothetical protein